jgi:2-C-methyl-D-erythritol 4-phosphate cytidylyltransferase
VTPAYAIVPAAGSGIRMGVSQPKQYLDIAGRPLLYHALLALARHPRIEQVFVVLAPGDARYPEGGWRELRARVTPLYCGGATRAASVFNGLLAARDAMAGSDWVLVHDAARPCLGREEIDRLFGELDADEIGGLLAIPVTDTLKRANRDARVAGTEPRDNLWLAQTPQMFRYRVLLEAMRAADPALVTDEARAVGALGLKPRLVMGDSRNIKVTYAEDLALAELILRSRQPGTARRMLKKKKSRNRTAETPRDSRSKSRRRKGRKEGRQ